MSDQRNERHLQRPVRRIWCCACGDDVEARLTDGGEIYPHRPDLKSLPFWKCDECGNCVGCHHKTKDRTRPLGCIPTDEIKHHRKQIHAIIDPLWRSGKITRQALYRRLSNAVGWRYHTANIRTVDEAKKVLTAAYGVAASLKNPPNARIRCASTEAGK